MSFYQQNFIFGIMVSMLSQLLRMECSALLQPRPLNTDLSECSILCIQLVRTSAILPTVGNP